ncbi:hypothetical protein ACN27E_25050 [Mycobacterium sp. WMMD1722]|uniref:hypothetical protein n=1 Tax=Mycobacterium sp. WMMD1722 TaxID=3404117 RepID=UPI003BF5A41F
MTHTVERRDRPWRSSRPALIIGPFDTPAVAEIEQAIGALTEAYPHSRLDWRFDASQRRWIGDRRPEQMVVEETGVPGQPVGDMLDDMWTRHSDGGPLTFIRYPHHLGLVMAHAVGDGRSFLEYLGGVAETAFTGQVAPWSSHTTGRFPLLTAGLRTFGRHPSLIRTALADKFEPEYPQASGTMLAWEPSRRTAVVAFPRSRTDEMVDWGRRFTPTPSRFVLLTCAVLSAMRAAGLAVSRDIHVLMDLRKYLGAGPINGNFVAGVPMRFEPDMTPQEFAASVKTTLRSGRPLANQILTSIRAGGFGYRTAQPDSYDPHAPLVVTVTDLGDSPYLEHIPFFLGEPSIYAAGGNPDGPLGVTIALTHTRDSTIATASFHDNAVDAAQMRQALDVLAAGPARLVCEPRLAR